MGKKLRCHPSYNLGEGRGWSGLINVVDEHGERVERFAWMCQAIDDDIDEAFALQVIDRVTSEAVAHDGFTSNGWDTHITRDKVWFEGLYNQGEGGAVTFAQYKLAVQTYLRFLADPERKPIEVEFPEA